MDVVEVLVVTELTVGSVGREVEPPPPPPPAEYMVRAPVTVLEDQMAPVITRLDMVALQAVVPDGEMMRALDELEAPI